MFSFSKMTTASWSNYREWKAPMIVDKDATQLIKKHDLINIAILSAIALVIGVYLIATTVLIAKDGVFYIERAQKLSIDPVAVIKAHPPGYPFLILAAHKLVMLFSNNSSVFMWIYSAQAVTLLCRLLALIPLYYIGKLLVGSRNSFLAMLVLILLPYPAKIGCDVVREWPYILFLATGFYFLLWGIKYDKCWVFGLVGLCSGLGYLIRPESTQLVVYGLVWVALSVFRPKLWGVSRSRNLIAPVLLLIGFAIPAVPYMKCTGQIIPPKVNSIMKHFSFNALPDKADEPKGNAVSSNYNTAEIVPRNVLKALGEIFKTIGENLMWFFLPALTIGLYYHFRNNTKFEELFLITTFITMNVVMMVLRYCYIQLHASQRWSLPLVVFTVFYIPIGLQILGKWLENTFSRSGKKGDGGRDKEQFWFYVLFIIGLVICIPKLVRPIRADKQIYRTAAGWLNKNTARCDIIAVPDIRISFFAERNGVSFINDWFPRGSKYVIKRFRSQGEVFLYEVKMKEKLSLVKNWQNEKNAIAVYQRAD
jgi:hypothetical protein